jgi:hypothetical protein
MYFHSIDYRILMGKPEGKTLVGRPRLRFDNNVKMDLRGVRFGDMVRIGTSGGLL